MKRLNSYRFLSAFSGGLLSMMAFSNAADAFFVGGVGFGVPFYAPAPAYYYPAYPAAVPVYYPPPAPPPAYDPTAISQDAPPPENCREFTRTVIIDSQKQQAYGNACRQPDGKWKIMK